MMLAVGIKSRLASNQNWKEISCLLSFNYEYGPNKLFANYLNLLNINLGLVFKKTNINDSET